MKLFKKLSIRIQILVIGAIIITLIPVVIALVYKQSSALIVQQNTQYNTELVSLWKQRISKNYANVSSLMMNLGYDTTVQSFLVESDSLPSYELSKKVQSLMGVIQNTNRDILDIVIISENGKYTSLAGSLNYAYAIRDALGSDGTVHYGGFRKATPNNSKDQLLFGMNVFSTGDARAYGDKIGYLMVALDVSAVNTELESYPRLAGTNIYLLDNKDVVYANSKDRDWVLNGGKLPASGAADGQTAIETIRGQQYAIQSYALPEITGRIVTAVPINNLTKKLDQLKHASYLLLAVTLLLVSLPYSILTMNILRPLTKLMAFMHRLKTGSLTVLNSQVALEGYAEIEVISFEFNTMMERINGLTERLVQARTQLYQAELEKQRAEFSYLQSQINPHFLGNTLDSIKGIALVKGVGEIYEMTAALSKMLRYSIQGTGDVSLGEELRIALSYIKIYQGRFPGKIAVEQHIEESLLALPVPKMIIQPIVENALAHGLEARAKSGELTIRVQRGADGVLEIIVADNGVGIQPGVLEQLERQLGGTDVSSTEHIGLLNVNNRLRLKYGEPYGIAVRSVAGQGTEVVLTLPLHQAK